MADIKFSCPQCNQHITCDELWGGHELQCPGCQGNLVVPAAPDAPAEAAKPLVPTPPRGNAPRISISRPQAHATEAASAAPAPNKPIPIRNLAPAIQKKQSPVVKMAVSAAVLVALGAGGYFGYVWYTDHQAKAAANGGQAGGGQDRAAVAGQPPSDNASNDAAATPPAPEQPVVHAFWTLDLALAKIPGAAASGSVSGTNFVAESARVDPVGTAHVLRLIQGPAASPDREILVYLHLKPGEKLGGQTLAISQDMHGLGVPQVSKRWKTNPRFAPVMKSFSTGYVMKLELGALADNALPGKIYLALPDTEQTFVAGTFKATVITPDPNMQVMPVASPASPAGSDAMRSAYEQRYGIRR